MTIFDLPTGRQPTDNDALTRGELLRSQIHYDIFGRGRFTVAHEQDDLLQSIHRLWPQPTVASRRICVWSTGKGGGKNSQIVLV